MFSLNSKRLFKLAYIAPENKKSTFQFAKKNWLETANREHQLKTALSRFCLNGHAKEVRNTLIDFRINHKSEWGLRQLVGFTTVYFVGIIFFSANLVPKRNYTLNSVMFASKTKILYPLFDQGRRFSFKLIENILQVVIEVVSNNYSGQTRSKQLKPTVNTSYVEIWRRQTVRLL